MDSFEAVFRDLNDLAHAITPDLDTSDCEQICRSIKNLASRIDSLTRIYEGATDARPPDADQS